VLKNNFIICRLFIRYDESDELKEAYTIGACSSHENITNEMSIF